MTVFLSWVFAPISSAILGALIFFLNRTIILRRKNSTEWAFWSLPVLALITVFINVFFVLLKVCRAGHPCRTLPDLSWPLHALGVN